MSWKLSTIIFGVLAAALWIALPLYAYLNFWSPAALKKLKDLDHTRAVEFDRKRAVVAKGVENEVTAIAQQMAIEAEEACRVALAARTRRDAETAAGNAERFAVEAQLAADAASMAARSFDPDGSSPTAAALAGKAADAAERARVAANRWADE